MSSLTSSEQALEFHAEAMLSDYVTAVTWSPDGKSLAVCSAAGEVMLATVGEINQLSLESLQSARGKSADCLSFSADSQFLAAGGQDGKVQIWRVNSGELIASLDNHRVWVDKLAWSPHCNQLAFSMGRCVQVWNPDDNVVEVTLNFDSSSILDLAWHPIVQYLAVSGYQGVKVWSGEDWDEDPEILSVPSATGAIAWSPQGEYLACGNMDNSRPLAKVKNSPPSVPPRLRGEARKIRLPPREFGEGWGGVSAFLQEV